MPLSADRPARDHRRPALSTPADLALRKTLRISELPAVYGVSRSTVSRMVRDGRLPATKTSRRNCMIAVADADRVFGVTKGGGND